MYTELVRIDNSLLENSWTGARWNFPICTSSAPSPAKAASCARRATAASRSVQCHDAHPAARSVDRRAALHARAQSPGTLAKRRAAARLRRPDASSLRRGAERRLRRGAVRRAAPRRAREHHGEPAAGDSRRVSQGVSGRQRRIDDGHQRCADRRRHRSPGGSRVRRGSAGEQGARLPAVVPRTAGDHLGRRSRADSPAAGRGAAIR